MQKRRTDQGSGRKTEVISIRLDPKLKYLAELGARKQRRTLSSFIEWAVERSLSDVLIEDDFDEGGLSVAEAEKKYRLWDVDEPDRLVQLATKYPDLLTLDEQIVWKTVRIFTGKWSAEEGITEWKELLREQWELVLAEADAMKATLERRKSARRGDGNSKEES